MYREDSKHSVNAVYELELFRLARLHELHSRIIPTTARMSASLDDVGMIEFLDQRDVAKDSGIALLDLHQLLVVQALLRMLQVKIVSRRG